MRPLTVVDDLPERKNARDFMETVTDLAWMPSADAVVEQGAFEDAVPDALQADLNIFGRAPGPDFEFVRSMVDATRSSCPFVADSGEESALA